MEYEPKRQERHPRTLLTEINALKPNEVMQFVTKNCAPGSDIFVQYRNKVEEIKARYMIYELTLAEMEYVACFALITDDIKNLPVWALTQATNNLQMTKPKSHLIKSLNWIDAILRSEYQSSLLQHHLEHINQTVPCYMNYSGLNLTHLESIENINFSNSMCRNFTSKDMNVKNCDFSNINWSGSTILNISGEGCNFGKAICENMTFLNAENVETHQAACSTFDKLHKFLSQSKGRDTLKKAILKDIIEKIKNISSDNTKEEVARVLYDHPLAAEHRSYFMSKTSRKTNSQNTITKEFGISDEVTYAHQESSYQELDLRQYANVEGEKGLSPVEFFQEWFDSFNEEGKLSHVFGRIDFKWLGNQEQEDYDDDYHNYPKKTSTCTQQ